MVKESLGLIFIGFNIVVLDQLGDISSDDYILSILIAHLAELSSHVQRLS